jgi:hypothetical protein
MPAGEAVELAQPPSPSGRRSSKRAALALAVAALVAGLATPAVGRRADRGRDDSEAVFAGPSPAVPHRRTGAAATSVPPDIASGPTGGTVPSAGGGGRFAGTRSRGSGRAGGSDGRGDPAPGAAEGADVGAAAGGIASTYQSPSDGGGRSRPSGDDTRSPAPDRATTTPPLGGIGSTPEPSSPTTTSSPTTRPSPTTTVAPTTTAPTTTVAPTTTTTQAPCRRGVIEPARSSFVFDGQSNSLSPTPDQSYAAKLMRMRWPDRMQHWALLAVGGTSFDQRAGWAPDRTDPEIARLGQPCAVLIQEGGPTDFADDLTAEQVLEANQRYTQGRRAAGFDVIVGATTPPLGWITTAQDAQRRAYNDLLRKYWRQVGLDALVDVAALPQLQDVKDERWFSDTTHFTDEASSVVADLYARTLP